jgi:lysophospholipase L1-like esterase
VVIAVGVFVGVSLHETPETSRDPRSSDARPIAKGDQYVAIGDSFTGAPGTGPAAANDGCQQSTTNYPHRVAKELQLKLTDVSCGFAMTLHVTAPQVLGASRRPPQIRAVTPKTDLVTISLGANDFFTYGSIVTSCTSLRAKDPDGAPCAEADAASGRPIETRVGLIEQRLTAVVRLVAKRAPEARIIVVGYPQFFPPSGPCEQLPLATRDYAFARRVNVLLVESQRAAAERTNAEYLDVFSATDGHDMCARDPWVAGLRPSRGDAAPWHPYPKEQRLVAKLIVDRLT